MTKQVKLLRKSVYKYSQTLTMEQQSFNGHEASYILFYNNFHSFPQTLHRICSQRQAMELKTVFINKLSMSRHIKLSPVPLATFYLRRCFAETGTDLTCEISIFIEYTFSIN